MVALVEHSINRLSERVIGAAIEVHRHLGPGLLESSYHECLCHELRLRGIRYLSKLPLPIEYKGVRLAKGYVVDLLVDNSLIIELKAVDEVLPIHRIQLQTYMRLQNVSAGLIMNFHAPTLPKGITRILS
jgi:GxxExxY protein